MWKVLNHRDLNIVDISKKLDMEEFKDDLE